jgi:Asp-tRNA(Asn)/Glu-tRNA(Gln) amidotransferase B subunit
MWFAQDYIAKLQKQADERVGRKEKKAQKYVNDCLELSRRSYKTFNFSKKNIVDWIENRKIDTDATTPKQLLDQMAGEKTYTVDEGDISTAVARAIAANAKAVADYKSGKEGAIMFLMGQVLRELKGNADKTAVLEALRDALSS